MSIARPVGLMARRTIALVLDLAVLISLLGFGCIIVAATDVKFLGTSWNPILLGAVLCYFGVFESLCLGQTPGKAMAGIRVHMSTGQRVTPYQAFARISLIVLSPLVLSLLYPLFIICRLITRPVPLVDSFTFALPWVIWPVSAIIGGGHTAMHDFLVRTVVARTKDSEDSRGLAVTWLYPWVVVFLASAITVVCVYRVFSPPVSSVTNFFDRIEGQERLACMQLARAAEDLSLRVENGPEFIADGPSVYFSRWTPDLWKEWSVKSPCIALPDNIRNGNVGFQLHTSYVIPVTRRGLVSAPFQEMVVRDICQRGMRPGVFTSFKFVYTSQVLIFVILAEKRCLAFMYSDVDEKGIAVTRMAILEPDYSVYVRPGIGLGDFTSGSGLPWHR